MQEQRLAPIMGGMHIFISLFLCSKFAFTRFFLQAKPLYLVISDYCCDYSKILYVERCSHMKRNGTSINPHDIEPLILPSIASSEYRLELFFNGIEALFFLPFSVLVREPILDLVLLFRGLKHTIPC